MVQATTNGLMDVVEAFKLLPGHDRHHTPRSEYLHKLLQPWLDDILFLGSDYEKAFDRFELLYALEYAHQENRDWAPIGRFGWKILEANPLRQVLSEAEQQGERWAPIVAGLFGGSSERFTEVARQLSDRTGRLGWF